MIIEKYENLLPYDKSKYINYLDEDYEGDCGGWKGVSIQNNGHLSKNELINTFNDLFTALSIRLNLLDPWIVSHDDKDMNWLLNGVQQLPKLNEFLTRETTDTRIEGAFVLDQEVVKSHFNELALYPSTLGYKNIDLSYFGFPLIVKLTAHLTMDILSNESQEVFENIDFLIGSNKRLVRKKYKD